MSKPGLKDLHHVFDTQGGSNYPMRRVVRLESSREILGANQGKVVLDGKYLILLVQVIYRGHHNAAGGYAEGRVLDSLELLNKGWELHT